MIAAPALRDAPPAPLMDADMEAADEGGAVPELEDERGGDLYSRQSPDGDTDESLFDDDDNRDGGAGGSPEQLHDDSGPSAAPEQDSTDVPMGMAPSVLPDLSPLPSRPALPPAPQPDPDAQRVPPPAPAHPVVRVRSARRPPPSEGNPEAVYLFGFAWGCFTFGTKQPSAKSGGGFGGYEARCPFHARNAKTGCKKFINVGGPEESDRARARLVAKWWCVQAPQHQRQWEHIFAADVASPPDEEVLEAMRIDTGPTAPVVPDDACASSVAGEDPPGAPKAKAKGRAKGRPKAKPKVKAEAPAPAAEVASEDGGAEGADSSSSSESSTSDSSKASSSGTSGSSSGSDSS